MDVNLSKAVRSNLLSLQNTATMMGKTQERLATGLKVNSALDNPTNFFTASGLKSRAGDLSQLMDSVSNAVQTIQAADKGISAMTKLVESAQATARQALQTSAPVATNTTTMAIGTDDAAQAADVGLTATNTYEIEDQNGNKQTYTFVSGTADAGAREFSDAEGLDALLRSDGIAVTATAGTTPATQVTLTSTSTAGDFSLSIEGAAATNYKATNETLIGPGGTTGLTGESVSITSAGRTETLTFGAGEGQISNTKELSDALKGLKGVDAKIVDGELSISTKGGNAFTIQTASTEMDTALGLPSGTNMEADGLEVKVTDADSKRPELVAQYNELLGQIDDLAKDASFNGVNLLNGDDLQVIFNEDGSSKLDIKGVTFNSSGLDLTELSDDAFNTNEGINGVLDSLKSGIEDLRTQASKFGSNLSVVETRQNFTKDMVNVLETGASNLTLADTNEEAANLLALQTRQQLSSTALSMASQSDQAVLRLF